MNITNAKCVIVDNVALELWPSVLTYMKHITS
jgi:hypothetical protein